MKVVFVQCFFFPKTDMMFEYFCMFAYINSFFLNKKSEVWSVLRGECLQTFTGHTALVNTVAFSEVGPEALGVG